MPVINMEPVERQNLTTQVMEKLKAYISSNKLVPGTKLPPERELINMLNVSRTILREALRALEAVGIIDIRPGDGTYVSDLDCSRLINHVSFLLTSKADELRQLLEVRLLVEVAALDLVAERMKREDVEYLERINDKLDDAETVEEKKEADLEFHRGVLEITGNAVLVEMSSFLSRFFQTLEPLIDPRTRHTDVAEHRAVLHALQEGHLAEAKSKMREHIEQLQELISDGRRD